MPIPTEPTDFVDGIVTIGGNGDPASQSGAAIHLYAANVSMRDRFFYNADGELLIVPQAGALTVHTEFGVLEVPPGHVVLIPRGIKFRVELPDGLSSRLRLRELRPALAPAGPRPYRHVWLGERARLPGARRGRSRIVKEHFAPDCQVRWRIVGGRDRSLAARHRRLARQLPAVPVRPLQVSVHQHGDLRSSRPIDLLRARVADFRSWHLQHGVWVFPPALDGGRTHVPSATLPQKRSE